MSETMRSYLLQAMFPDNALQYTIDIVSGIKDFLPMPPRHNDKESLLLLIY